MKSTIGAVLALGITLAAPTAASASTFSVTNNGAPGAGPSVSWTAEAGKANAVRVTGSPSQVVISDTTDAITTPDGDGCTTPNDTTLVCVPSAGTFSGVMIDAGDADDSVIDSTSGFNADFLIGGAAVTLSGGEGADTLQGGPSTDTIDGGPGADTVNGGGGNDILGALASFGGAGVDDGVLDRISGDAGDDLFVAVDAGDVLDGGTGEDSLLNLSPLANLGGGITVRLDGATPTTGNGYAGQDLTLSGFETAYGGGGDDKLTGSAAQETLIGFGGSDTIDGGGGVDFLYGNGGTDYLSLVLNGGIGIGGPPAFQKTPDGSNVITSRDGTVDRVDCGAGTGTTLNADDIDALSHCPAVGAGTTLTPVPAPAAQTVNVPVPTPVLDKVKARISGFKAAKKAKGKGLRKNGRYSVAFTSNEATVGSVVLLAKAKSATIAKAGDLQLASKAIRTTAGKKQTVKLVVGKKLRKLLKKGRRFTVVVTLVDGGGNTTTKTQAVKVG